MGNITIGNLKIGEGIPKICAPLTGNTEEELRKQCENIGESKVDLVEWRVDFYDHDLGFEQMNDILVSLKEMLGDIPLIFTFRTKEEGGEKSITDEEYFLLNKKAIQSKKIEFVDIELFRGDSLVTDLITLAKENGVYTIISNHDFDKTPAKVEITQRLKKAMELGGDLPKIAVMPHSERDVLTLLEATLDMKENHSNQPIVTMSMGGKGVISRVSGGVFGSAITFGAVGDISAPGQISVESLRQSLKTLDKAH